MAGQRGRDVLIKLGDGGSPESFFTVAGIRTKTITMGVGQVDITSADSPGQWRELLVGAGTRRIEVSGSGVFKDAASDARLREAFMAGEAVHLKLVIPDFGDLTGPFQIADLSYGGAHDGEAAMGLRLLSAGQVTFEVAA